MDIYVWSIEDRHTVRVEACGVRLEAACFTDVRVARNFRDWLAGLAGLDVLMQDVGIYKGVGYRIPSPASYDLVRCIMERRQHPAQLWRNNILNIVQLPSGDL